MIYLIILVRSVDSLTSLLTFFLRFIAHKMRFLSKSRSLLSRRFFSSASKEAGWKPQVGLEQGGSSNGLLFGEAVSFCFLRRSHLLISGLVFA
jgi:hypothetical protein